MFPITINEFPELFCAIYDRLHSPLRTVSEVWRGRPDEDHRSREGPAVQEGNWTAVCSLSNRPTRRKQREIWGRSRRSPTPSRARWRPAPFLSCFWWHRVYDCVSPEVFCDFSSLFNREQRALRLTAGLFMFDHISWDYLWHKNRNICPGGLLKCLRLFRWHGQL